MTTGLFHSTMRRMRLAVLILLLYVAPAGAALYTCTVDGKTVFQSAPCPGETKDVTKAPPERSRPVPQPAKAPPRPAAMDTCTSSSDCPKGFTCRRRADAVKGICWR